ncbi:MAG TPA: serine/threonine-protein kinase [Caldimonas sp.]|jgi:hypothetical protein
MSPVHEAEAVRASATTPGHTLPIGTRLREYEIKGLIGEGTCSIVYLGWDHALQRKVAIKEYMPAAMAGRLQGSTGVVIASERHLDAVKAGMRSFLNEARVLARFDHPSLVKIYRFWEENGTAYMVMPYYEGPTLKATLAELGHVPSEAELRAWLKPILNAVTLLHEGAVWHQNIGPDEIVLTPFGPVLLGFAGAAHAIEAMKHTPAAALKPGYAAIEQYGSEAGTTRGPWTDLYALAAVVHAAITGNDPPPAADRLTEDRMRPLSIVAAGLYSDRFLAAIDAAMAVQPRRRPPDHAEFRALMGDIEAPEAVSLAPAPDLMQEPFTGSPARGREVTVPDPPPTPTSAPAAPAVAEVKPRAIPKTSPTRALDDGERSTPSWMQSAHARGLGKRALYGVIAGTCALIGIAALVLQFATRPAPRNAAATAAASAAPGAAPGAVTTTAAAAAVAPTTAGAIPAPRSTTATAPTLANAPAPRAVVAGPAPAVAAAATPAVRVPPQAVRTSAPVAAPAIVTATPLERQARCTEILQKASLEKITAAETEFFKRECK